MLFFWGCHNMTPHQRARGIGAIHLLGRSGLDADDTVMGLVFGLIWAAFSCSTPRGKRTDGAYVRRRGNPRLGVG